MVGIYLSRTGNTRHCIEKLVMLLDENAKVLPIEDEDAVLQIMETDFIVLGYPTQFSNAPLMVRDFIRENASIWKGKRILCVATMGAFSGDGAGCTARILKKYGAIIAGGLHIHMPDSVCDSKLLKKSLSENKQIVKTADQKIESAAARIAKGIYPREGLGFIYHLTGLFGQRLWFYGKTQHYSNRVKISDACVGCGLCAAKCPMHNVTMQDGRPKTNGKCTMCYRCVSSCPKQAITLLGKEVQEQCRFEKYI
ncbi:MAG: EFR1 family ferrodoxin [Lachnospiraceae bacterium]|nr:EFR1 family ferrodoxin [Lachnospiraceae bacterium]